MPSLRSLLASKKDRADQAPVIPGKHIETASGRLLSKEPVFREWVSREPNAKFQPEAGRYHLYVSLASPWAHQCLIVLKLKGLEEVIEVSYTTANYDFDTKGHVRHSWKFDVDPQAKYRDKLFGFKDIRKVYHHTDHHYKGDYSVPVLYDKKLNAIVNNSFSDIVRMLNSEFNELARNRHLDLYPSHLQGQVDSVIEKVHDNVSLGVLRCGYAETQEEYDEAFKNVFAELDDLDLKLSTSRYLCGATFTEADIRLFSILIRFDVVYHCHYKCNGQYISEFPNLWEYMKEIYHMEEVKETVDFEFIKEHYYKNQPHLNPSGIIPRGPQGYVESLEVPHKRDEMMRTSLSIEQRLREVNQLS